MGIDAEDISPAPAGFDLEDIGPVGIDPEDISPTSIDPEDISPTGIDLQDINLGLAFRKQVAVLASNLFL